MKKKLFVTSDLWTASAITLLLKQPPEYKVENGRTLFIFPGSADTYGAISDFNSGILSEYAQIIKRLKVEMLTRRQQPGAAQ